MTSNKTTKKALFASAMSLLLCVAMLIGSTFAWFTDSASSKGNKIMAGNLDVDLLLWDGDSYEDIGDSEEPIFGSYNSDKAQNVNIDTLWEPGKTQVAYLKIKNNGNLALKYQVALNTVNPADGKNLYEVMQYQIVPDAANGEDVQWDGNSALKAKLGTEIVSGDAAVEMDPGVEHDFALLVHMDENANNDYMDGKVEFDITVLATQLNAEEDSFGPDYDKDLETSGDGISRVLSDGSTVFYYNEESSFAGRVRLIALPENLGSEYVVPAGVNDLGGALAGATLDKLTIPAGVQYAYKSLQGTTIGEVVLEEGTTVIPNRMFYQAKFDNIVIPSSVIIIEQNAFAMSTAATLTIPASVTTVEEAAFQHMDNLTTVTFEGNTAIQGYAFRGCDILSNVYLNGEDVTFIASTLSGKDSCWFCNGESGNPGTSTIKFYVKNDTVAKRVKVAMGAELFGDGKNQIFKNGTECDYTAL